MSQGTVSSQGAQSIMYVEPGASPHTFDASSELLVYDSETLRLTDEMVDAHGVRGTRSHHHGRVVTDRANVGGNIVCRPGQQTIERWIQRILGGTTVAGVTPVAEVLNSHTFGVLINRVAGWFAYTDCKVNQAIIRGSSGQVLQMELEVFGQDEDDTATISFPPTYTSANNRLPIVFSSGTLTLGAESRKFESFTLTINNFLVRNFWNSPTAQELAEQDRLVTFSPVLPWTTELEDELYALGRGGTADGKLSFRAATGDDIDFKFGALVAPRETPTVPGKSNIPFPLNFTAYQTNTAKEIEVEISTPA